MKNFSSIASLCLLICLVCSQGTCPTHGNPEISGLKVESDSSVTITNSILLPRQSSLSWSASPLEEKTISLSGWSTAGGNDVYLFTI